MINGIHCMIKNIFLRNDRSVFQEAEFDGTTLRVKKKQAAAQKLSGYN